LNVNPSAHNPASEGRTRSPAHRSAFAFDLWSHDDVAADADAILERLQAATMPCDGAWPADKVEVFRRWVESGAPE
jgi:hypothetical protein